MTPEQQLKEIVWATPWLVDVLQAVRVVNPPDWAIGAGALQSAVWDNLHGLKVVTQLRDIDVAFFDANDLTSARDTEVEAALLGERPEIKWDATNQAAVHLWFPDVFGYQVKPLTSTEEAISTWPETSTSVGVRLTEDEELEILAPVGLEDLLGMVHRRNPKRVSVDEYHRRLERKRIKEKWPLATIVM